MTCRVSLGGGASPRTHFSQEFCCFGSQDPDRTVSGHQEKEGVPGSAWSYLLRAENRSFFFFLLWTGPLFQGFLVQLESSSGRRRCRCCSSGSGRADRGSGDAEEHHSTTDRPKKVALLARASRSPRRSCRALDPACPAGQVWTGQCESASIPSEAVVC